MEYWEAKFDANVLRDALAVQRLEALGWRVETLWECEIRDNDALIARLRHVFNDESCD
jgi:DNA mismatch endonuclease (patch repair protein)